MSRTLNSKAIAEALAIKAPQLSRWAQEPSFPCDKIAGERLMDVAEVRAWIASNKRRRGPRDPRPLPAPAPSPDLLTPPAVQPPAPRAAPVSMLSPDDPILADLRSGDALRVTRAAAKLAGVRVAQSACDGTLGVNDLDDLKKALGELRQAEDSYIELGIRKGEIIERNIACEIIGACCARLVEALSVIENAIAVELDMWLSDGTFLTASSEFRQRKIREYVGKKCYEVRRQEAEGVDAMIDSKLVEEKQEIAQ